MKHNKYFTKISKILIILLYFISCNQMVAAPKIKHNLYDLNNLKSIDYKHQKLISYYLKIYSRNNELSKIINKSKPAINYIIKELQKRNLPEELFLLPVIESSYKPYAKSNKGAFGIWQISFVTGKRYGLIKYNNDYRTDLIASTNAALDYLEFLYNKFDHDWLLALAAYNAGEGRVSKAIQKNKLAGKNIDFWSLPLPEQTKQYVPKFLALTVIFNNNATNHNHINQGLI